MASILQIGNRWRAQIRRSGHKSMAETFPSKREAEAWARQKEVELDAFGTTVAGTTPARNLRMPVVGVSSSELKLADLINEYRDLRATLGRPIDPSSNTHYMLNHLEEDLGDETPATLTPKRMSEWAKARHDDGAGGWTVNQELGQLGTVIKHTSSFLGIRLPDVVGEARPLLNYAQLISGGNRRTRRPTEDELERLLGWMDTRDPLVAEAIRVAAVTGLRRGELARIVWEDLDEDRKAVLVRQRKHPRRVEAKDEWVPLLGESWEVVQRQPRTTGEARIFPVSRERLTDRVTEGTRALGIPDLRLHDMRREATSALRDLGFDADARKAVTGHKSDAIHSRYVAVKLEDLHRQYDAARSGSEPRPQRPRSVRGRLTVAK